MKLSRFCRGIATTILATALSAMAARGQQAVAYPDTEAGMQQFIGDILQATQNGDQPRLDALLASLIIPNYQRWFVEIFGPEEGDRLANAYKRELKDVPKNYRAMFGRAAEPAEPQLKIEAYLKADDTLAGRYWGAFVKAMRRPLPIYSVGYRRDNNTWQLGHYVHVDGAFRVLDITVITALSTMPPMRIRIGGNVAQAKLLHQPRPVYPLDAKMQGIQGKARLQVILAADGSVMEVQQLEGHPLLLAAAADAVRQWRYQPTLLNGKPVEVVTTIEVIFTLQLPKS